MFLTPNLKNFVIYPITLPAKAVLRVLLRLTCRNRTSSIEGSASKSSFHFGVNCFCVICLLNCRKWGRDLIKMIKKKTLTVCNVSKFNLVGKKLAKKCLFDDVDRPEIFHFIISLVI